MNSINNVIQAARCCYSSNGRVRCKNCPYDRDWENQDYFCEQELYKDMIAWLTKTERILNAADPHDADWVISIIRERNADDL